VQVSKDVAFNTQLAVRGAWLSKASRDRGAEYQLVATVSHHGRGTGLGHYTADVLQPDGRWLRFDDGNVFLVSTQAVLSDRPYLLFYQRLDSRQVPQR
jgi:ubiquitin carboxyl-terminal hydrolase 10